jgi:predicted nucleic acid-binding protein
MKITADTNVLVRAVVDDDVAQSARAREALAGADLVALTPAALCEFVWVLRRGYGVPYPEIARTLRVLLASDNVAADTAPRSSRSTDRLCASCSQPKETSLLIVF